MKIGKLTQLGLYTAMALIIFMVEQAFPMLTPLPFLKLGLSNVITLLVLALYHPKDAFLVLLMRIVLASIFAGQGVYFLYSMFGGMACFLAEVIVYRLLRGQAIWLVSIFGAVFHNLGQMLAGVLLMGNAIFLYLPYFVLAGVLTGLMTGVLAAALIPRLKKILKTES